MKKVPFGTIIRATGQKVYLNLKRVPKLLSNHIIIVTIVAGLCVISGTLFILWPKPKPPANPPVLVVSQPNYVNDQTMIIKGQTDPGDTVLIDSSLIKVQPDGSFTDTLYGTITSRIMRIVATNSAGLEKVDELDIIPPDVSARDSLPQIPQTAAPDGGSASSNQTGANQAASDQSQVAAGASNPSSSAPQAAGAVGAALAIQNAPKQYLTLSVPAKTNNPDVKISGSATPGTTVTINGEFSVTIGKDACYNATIKLTNPGANAITVSESDKAWGSNVTAKHATVIYVTSPEIQINYLDPQFNIIQPLPASTSASYLKLSISVQDLDLYNGVSVVIGTQTPVKLKSGSMTYTWNLVSGVNTLRITVTDDVGNSTIKTISVNH